MLNNHAEEKRLLKDKIYDVIAPMVNKDYSMLNEYKKEQMSEALYGKT